MPLGFNSRCRSASSAYIYWHYVYARDTPWKRKRRGRSANRTAHFSLFTLLIAQVCNCFCCHFIFIASALYKRVCLCVPVCVRLSVCVSSKLPTAIIFATSAIFFATRTRRGDNPPAAFAAAPAAATQGSTANESPPLFLSPPPLCNIVAFVF